MSSRAIVAITGVSVMLTVYAVAELTRYILAWQATATDPPLYLSTQIELAGMWALWLVWQVFLAMLLTRVTLK